MIPELRRDRARYAEYGVRWWGHPGFWITAVYRLGAWGLGLPLAFRIPVGVLYRILKLPWRLLFNVEIPANACIGGGLCLIHPANVLVGGGTIIGEDCLVFHEVTLGRGAAPGMPRIGNRVQVFVGARVLGPVSIGDGCKIGANCVVTRNVPPGSAVMSAPNRVISLSRLGTLDAATPDKADEVRPLSPAARPRDASL